MTTGFTDERVRGWVAATPRRWPRWVLVTLWAAAFVASIVSDTEPCTVEEPCGPDLAFSLAMVLCFASAVLLWWRPLVATVCAVGFGLVELILDPIVEAKVAWTLVAAAFVGYAAHVLSMTARQRAIATQASAPVPPWPNGPHRPLRFDGPHRLMAAGAVGLVLVASGAVYGYQRAAALEAEHLSRSGVVEGVVLSDEDEDGNQKVRLDARPEGFPAELDVLFLDVPTVGLGALLLAGLLAERLLAVRVRRRVLEESHHATGVPVRVFTDDLDFVGLVATDSARGLGEFPVDEVLRIDSPEGRRIDAPTEAFLVGDIRQGGWTALVRPDGMRLPLGPLVALPEGTEIDTDSFDRDPEDPREWSEPLPMGTIPVPLPVVVEASLWHKAAGLAVALGAVFVGSWLLWDDEVGVSGAGVVFAAGSVLHWGLERFAHRVRVTSGAFEMVSVFSAVESPMGAVREVRVDDEVAVVIFDDESVLDIAPDDGDHRGLAAAIERAAESAPRLPDGTAPHSHIPWTAAAFGAGALSLVATWLMHWLF